MCQSLRISASLFLVAVVVLVGCSDALGPEPLADSAERFPGLPDGFAASWTGSSDDPRAFVFEDLGPPRDLLDRLGIGGCVVHYRRPNGKYTPIPFVLREFSATAVESAGMLQPTGVMYRLRRGEQLAVRAVCKIPHSWAALTEAANQLEVRVREPGLVRDANGAVRISGGTLGIVGKADEDERTRSRTPKLAPRVASLMQRIFPPWRLGPAPLAAQSDGGGNCTWDDDLGVYVCDGIVAEGEDPCDDEFGYWDDAWEECVCWNGEDWGDPNPYEGEEPCEDADDWPSDDDGSGGDDHGSGGSGGGGSNEDGPPDGVDPDDWDWLNPAERLLCKQHPIQCAHYIAASKIAVEWAKQATDSNGFDLPGRGNGPQDAVQHAFWSAHLTRLIGAESALEWTDAHETSSCCADQTQMDVHNNSVGREIGLAPGYLGDEVIEAYAAGRLIWLNESQWSDWGDDGFDAW